MQKTIADIVDIFGCCLFTPKVLTTVLPAFALAGAIGAFVPRSVILRYLGPGSSPWCAYPVAALSGFLLPLCSCNVVPLFLGIYYGGAGIGPAFAFLYAGPAINVVSSVFTFRVVGTVMGLWRVLGIPILAILVGIGAARLFSSEERARLDAASFPRPASSAVTAYAMDIPPLAAWLVPGLSLLAVVWGGLPVPWITAALGIAAIFATAIYLVWLVSGTEGLRLWASETWRLFLLVIPWLIPSIFLIGLVAANIDVKFVYRLVGQNSAPHILFATAFGTLMYFPILSEVALTRAFLKLGMAPGPALAILLTGAGLSLPGAIVLGRAIGARKVVYYMLATAAAAFATAMLFAHFFGEYICPCLIEGR